MKILLIHPEDDAESGPWSSLRWSRIIDLGVGGKSTYSRWTEIFRCPVESLNIFRQGLRDFRHIRDLLRADCGRLIDRHGLDWWEILCMLLSDEMEPLLLLQRFAETTSPEDEVHVSRSCLHADLLSILLPRTQIFPLRPEVRKHSVAHYVRVSSRLSAQQIVDVFWDKYDSGYQLRGRFARRRSASSDSVVLLPSAYVNVSRTAIAYASLLPEQKFLLVATRNSGCMRDLPSNVAVARLSSYASLSDRSAELAELESAWNLLSRELIRLPEFHILERLGSLHTFGKRFCQGLQIRDAWLNVLAREPVQAVFCADDSNPNTRIPILLARDRNLPTVACHHGALDGQNIYKRAHAGAILAKGEMEKDYLVRECEVPEEIVEIGAPPTLSSAAGFRAEPESVSRPHILFISEPAEVTGGRGREIYQDILPRLADLALKTGRKVIVKLHPAESRNERSKTVDRVLTRGQRQLVQIVDGPLNENLLSEAWFGVTILSTVATECAIRGVPCFLCRWLEFSFYGYVDQFIRFGAGIALNRPEDIAGIPQYLEQHSFEPNVLKNFWQAITAERLKEMLSVRPRGRSLQVHTPEMKASVAS